VLFCSSINRFFNNKMTNWKSYVNSHIMFPCMHEFFFFFFFYCDIWSGYHILHADNDSDKYLDNVVAG
jgi:hypothetical protein